MLTVKEKRTPQDIIHGLVEADNLFEDIVDPQIDKLTYLKEVCDNGVIGHDPSWHEEYYMKLSRGLGLIIEETINALEDFYRKLNERADEYRQDPEFKKWVAKHDHLGKKGNELWEKYTGMCHEEEKKLEAELFETEATES